MTKSNEYSHNAFIEELKNCGVMAEFNGNNALHFRRTDFPEYFSSIISVFPNHIETRNVMNSEDMEPETIRFFHGKDIENPSQWIDEYLYFSDQIAIDDLTVGYRILEAMKEDKEINQRFMAAVMETISRDPIASEEYANMSGSDIRNMTMASRCVQIAENVKSMIHIISIPEIIDELKEINVIGASDMDIHALNLLAGKAPPSVRKDAVPAFS